MMHHRHHRRHKPFFSSKRDRDAPSAPEELMRSLNFPSENLITLGKVPSIFQGDFPGIGNF